ncbi:MAG: four helix bundle protein [Deltaproteobacteria bacterium]|nr:four helix bundle protein [Deltaproteobacteria bacterium]
MNDELEKKKPQDLKERTKQFALRIIRLYVSLPNSTVAQVIGRQILRSGTSVGAQYREGTRARSDAEFISKIEGALQELEETRYWMELLVDGGIVAEAKMRNIVDEADQLAAILVSSVKTVKKRRQNEKS